MQKYYNIWKRHQPEEEVNEWENKAADLIAKLTEINAFTALKFLKERAQRKKLGLPNKTKEIEEIKKKSTAKIFVNISRFVNLFKKIKERKMLQAWFVL